MSMHIWNFLAGVMDPIERVIDNVHTSEEEKLSLKAEAARVQGSISLAFLDYEKQLLQSRAQIITAEAQGQSWIQRSWRPITMLTFLALVVCDSFGLLAFRLSDQAWELLKIGLGGYVVGRTVEKVAPNALDRIFRKDGRDGTG